MDKDLTSGQDTGIVDSYPSSPSFAKNVVAASTELGSKSSSHSNLQWIKNRSLRFSGKLKSPMKSGLQNVDDLLSLSHTSLELSSKSQRSIHSSKNTQWNSNAELSEQNKTSTVFGSRSKHGFALPSLLLKGSSHTPDKMLQGSRGTITNLDDSKKTLHESHSKIKSFDDDDDHDYDFDTRTVNSFDGDNEEEMDDNAGSSISSRIPANACCNDASEAFELSFSTIPTTSNHDKANIPASNFMSELANSVIFHSFRSADWSNLAQEEIDIPQPPPGRSRRSSTKSLIADLKKVYGSDQNDTDDDMMKSNHNTIKEMSPSFQGRREPVNSALRTEQKTSIMKINQNNNKEVTKDGALMDERRESLNSTSPTEETTSTESMSSLEFKKNTGNSSERPDDFCNINAFLPSYATSLVTADALERDPQSFLNRKGSFHEEIMDEDDGQNRRFTMGDYLDTSKNLKKKEDPLLGSFPLLPPPRNHRDELAITQRRREHRESLQRRQEEISTKMLNESFARLRYDVTNDGKKKRSTKSAKNTVAAMNEQKVIDKSRSKSAPRCRNKSLGRSRHGIKETKVEEKLGVTEGRMQIPLGSKLESGERNLSNGSKNETNRAHVRPLSTKRRRSNHQNEVNIEAPTTKEQDFRFPRRLSNDESLERSHKETQVESRSHSEPKRRLANDEGETILQDVDTSTAIMSPLKTTRRQVRSPRKKSIDGSTAKNDKSVITISETTVQCLQLTMDGAAENEFMTVCDPTVSTPQLIEERCLSSSLPAVSSQRRRRRRLQTSNNTKAQTSTVKKCTTSSESEGEKRISSLSPIGRSTRRIVTIEENKVMARKEIEATNRTLSNGEENNRSMSELSSRSVHRRTRRQGSVNTVKDEGSKSKVKGLVNIEATSGSHHDYTSIEEKNLSISLPAGVSRRRMSHRSLTEETDDNALLVTSNHNHRKHRELLGNITEGRIVDGADEEAPNHENEFMTSSTRIVSSRRRMMMDRANGSGDDYTSTEEVAMSSSLPGVSSRRRLARRSNNDVKKDKSQSSPCGINDDIILGNKSQNDNIREIASSRFLHHQPTSGSDEENDNESRTRTPDDYTSSEEVTMSSSLPAASSRRRGARRPYKNVIKDPVESPTTTNEAQGIDGDLLLGNDTPQDLRQEVTHPPLSSYPQSCNSGDEGNIAMENETTRRHRRNSEDLTDKDTVSCTLPSLSSHRQLARQTKDNNKRDKGESSKRGIDDDLLVGHKSQNDNVQDSARPALVHLQPSSSGDESYAAKHNEMRNQKTTPDDYSSSSLPTVSPHRQGKRRPIEKVTTDPGESSTNAHEAQITNCGTEDDMLLGNNAPKGMKREINDPPFSSHPPPCSSGDESSHGQEMNRRFPRSTSCRQVSGPSPVKEKMGKMWSSSRNMKQHNGNDANEAVAASVDLGLSRSERLLSPLRLSRRRIKTNGTSDEKLVAEENGMSRSLPASSSRRHRMADNDTVVDGYSTSQSVLAPIKETAISSSLASVQSFEYGSSDGFSVSDNGMSSTISAVSQSSPMSPRRRCTYKNGIASPTLSNLSQNDRKGGKAKTKRLPNTPLTDCEQQTNTGVSDLAAIKEEINPSTHEMDVKSSPAARMRNVVLSPFRRLRRSTRHDSVQIFVSDILDMDLEGQ